MKKALALISAAALILSLAACGNKTPEENTTVFSDETTVQSADAPTAENEVTDTAEEGEEETEAEEETEEPETNAEGETVKAPEKKTEGKSDSKTQNQNKPSTPGAKTEDPSSWNTAKIVEYYKTAVNNTEKKNVKSKQTMSLKQLDGGSGVVGKLITAIKPIGEKALAKNSTEFDGITGNTSHLSASDIQSAKAYKSGNYIVIEMKMKDQTDGPKGKDTGTVANAIGTLGSIDKAIKELNGVEVDYSQGNITLKYTDATVKVKINPTTGVIEKGSWGHNVNVTLTNVTAKVAIIKATLNGSKMVIGYNIAFGGGF